MRTGMEGDMLTLYIHIILYIQVLMLKSNRNHQHAMQRIFSFAEGCARSHEYNIQFLFFIC